MLVKAGVYCLRGGCHWATYDQDEAYACGTKGPDVFIDVDMADYALYPQWLQEVIDDAIAERAPNMEGVA